MRRRVAAGTALFAAVVAIGGPGIAAAPADPGGGSHRDRGDGHRRDNGGDSRNDTQRGSSRGDSRGRGDGDRNDGNGNDGNRNDRDDRDQRGERGNGGYGNQGNRGRDDDRTDSAEGDDGGSEWVDQDDSTSEGVIASRGASSGLVAARGVTVESDSVGVQSIDIPEAPTTPAGGTTAPVVAAGGGGGAVPGEAPVPIDRPTVVFGNGRTTGLLSGGSAVADVPAGTPGQVAATAPEVPLAPIVIAPTLPTAIPDVGADPALPWVVSEIWSPVGPGGNSGALFGLAGLILIPLAGVWLGYRQAQAARAAADLATR